MLKVNIKETVKYIEKTVNIIICIFASSSYLVSFLNDLGFKTISLGKRILRCETAAVYALSVISYLLEK